MKKGLLALGLIILLGGIIFFATRDQNETAPLTDTEVTGDPVMGEEDSAMDDEGSMEDSDENEDTMTEEDPVEEDDEEDQSMDQSTREVVYSGSGYSETDLTIKKGTTVVFKNQSNIAFWPASDPHPVHTNYSVFDALEPLDPGREYSFTFNETGEFGFHDHLRPNRKGVIRVVE